MKRIQMGGLALMAMVAFGVLSTASASAHLFLWSGETGSLILAFGQGKQIFTPSPGGSQVICNTLKLDGKIESKGSLTQKLSGEYTGCNAFGLGATVSPVEYEFSADESVKILKHIIITGTGPCHILVLPNQSVGVLTYLKDSLNANALLVHSFVTGIHAILLAGEPPGTACEAALGNGTLSNTGTYTGLALVFVHSGGTLTWE